MSFFWKLYNSTLPPCHSERRRREESNRLFASLRVTQKYNVILREHKRPKNLKRFFTSFHSVQNDNVGFVIARAEWGPRRSPAKRVRWGKGRRRECSAVFAKGGNETARASSDAVAIRSPLRSGYYGFPRSLRSLGMTFLHPCHCEASAHTGCGNPLPFTLWVLRIPTVVSLPRNDTSPPLCHFVNFAI